ncbi:hypothetical protein ACELLULO517_26405 [Acidisoma cellulosilytica]|uniref:Uncharacterized protein n=1 Tax=Acidisoma cellulosilyticum TaxID=2802395 RepID=A0A963Z6P5_9PROT|nr:hypothetical protein [Acidisoma cellulosilyticum]MCB8883807.1 hypothetical protein [Acidisoma cellulosilyticum]
MSTHPARHRRHPPWSVGVSLVRLSCKHWCWRIILYELTDWGLSDLPRLVGLRPDAKPGRRSPAGHTVLGYVFFIPGDTPHVGVARIAAAWPALRFVP